MAIPDIRLLQKVLLITAVIHISSTAKAQINPNPAEYQDSTIRHLLASNAAISGRSVNLPKGDYNETAFSNNREQKRLLGYLKELKIPETADKFQAGTGFYYHLANVFAKCHLYPLAMKCYLKSTFLNRNEQKAFDLIDSNEVNAGYLNLTLHDDSLVRRTAQVLKTAKKATHSKPVSYRKIINSFDDGKRAVTFALLFHVKQPVPGKPKIYVGSNIGHSFITLIKYNADSTFVSASVGFYPKKDGIFFEATPICPTSSSQLENDAEHTFDEAIGTFISRSKFERILKMLADYEGAVYNLNKNNCTDFALNLAAAGGLRIDSTSGKWPLGKGNNPGVTGQSILNGKFSHLNGADIFVSFDINEE